MKKKKNKSASAYLSFRSIQRSRQTVHQHQHHQHQTPRIFYCFCLYAAYVCLSEFVSLFFYLPPSHLFWFLFRKYLKLFKCIFCFSSTFLISFFLFCFFLFGVEAVDSILSCSIINQHKTNRFSAIFFTPLKSRGTDSSGFSFLVIFFWGGVFNLFKFHLHHFFLNFYLTMTKETEKWKYYKNRKYYKF